VLIDSFSADVPSELAMPQLLNHELMLMVREDLLPFDQLASKLFR
jgi:hypothetical protein